VQPDRPIHNNKPEIVIRDNKKGRCVLIDIAISENRNVIKKEAENILIYKDLTKEIEGIHSFIQYCLTTSNSNNNKGNCDHLKISKKTA
jgi:hypothetical protein